jgi:aryl-alcohol dehydrogenase-like predicted oxidoreductase
MADKSPDQGGSMDKRQLGRSALRVPPLCLGGNVFGWTADKAVSFDLLDRALEAGLDFIDTAEMYSVWVPGHRGGESEEIIGEWLASRGCRERVVIATKVGADMGDGRKGLAPARIREGIEGSLKRLRTDRIDLYWAHYDDPHTPFEDVLGTFAALIGEGKVRVIGASNIAAPRLREALATSAAQGLPHYECLQPHYNLYDRAVYEDELEPTCVAHGLGVACYFGLAKGFLTGKYRHPDHLGQSPRGGGVANYLTERGMRILAALDEVAGQLRATPAQVALAWLMARPSITAPIASATTPAQLADLIAAMHLTLDRGTIARLDSASA